MKNLELLSENVQNYVDIIADLFEKFNNLFDCLNSQSVHARNPYRFPLQKCGQVRDYLKEVKLFISTIKF